MQPWINFRTKPINNIKTDNFYEMLSGLGTVGSNHMGQWWLFEALQHKGVGKYYVGPDSRT